MEIDAKFNLSGDAILQAAATIVAARIAAGQVGPDSDLPKEIAARMTDVISGAHELEQAVASLRGRG